MKRETIFTENFITMYSFLKNKRDKAYNTVRNLESLNISNEKIETELSHIIDRYKTENDKALEFLSSFLPDEFVKEIGKFRTSGCFVTDTTGTISLNLEMAVHTKDDNFRFKFDNEERKLYNDDWGTNTEFKQSMIDKYFESAKPSMNAWVRVK